MCDLTRRHLTRDQKRMMRVLRKLYDRTENDDVAKMILKRAESIADLFAWFDPKFDRDRFLDEITALG